MPEPIELLKILPALPNSAALEMQRLVYAVVKGAYPLQLNYRILVLSDIDQTLLSIECANDSSDMAVDNAIRIAESALRLIASLSRQCGVFIRQSMPSCRALTLRGLTWSSVGASFIKLMSTSELPTAIELRCVHTEHYIRLSSTRTLSSSTNDLSYLCCTVTRRRSTTRSHSVRIKCGRRELSIVLPNDVHPTAIRSGMLINTTKINGSISRRLVESRRCQLSLLNDD